MSDGGDAFLARWSRRKSQAHAETKPDHACGEGQKQPEATAEAGATAGDPAREPADDQEEIALEDLPPIDSIDASTDLAFWLRQKVPDAWKQAVLSRAWAADPAISQFVGLAENSWDWNVPGGVPGLAPSVPRPIWHSCLLRRSARLRQVPQMRSARPSPAKWRVRNRVRPSHGLQCPKNRRMKCP